MFFTHFARILAALILFLALAQIGPGLRSPSSATTAAAPPTASGAQTYRTHQTAAAASTATLTRFPSTPRHTADQ